MFLPISLSVGSTLFSALDFFRVVQFSRIKYALQKTIRSTAFLLPSPTPFFLLTHKASLQVEPRSRTWSRNQHNVLKWPVPKNKHGQKTKGAQTSVSPGFGQSRRNPWFTPRDDSGCDDFIWPIVTLCFVLLLTFCSPSLQLFNGILSQ